LDPAEEIVELWLHSKGYFTRNGVMVGHKNLEIDFLAVDSTGSKRLHVESTVSVNPFGPLRPWGPAKYSKLPFEERVKLYYQKKFVGLVDEKTRELQNDAIERKVKEVFEGKPYEKWLVLGEQEEGNEKIRNAFRRYGVEVHYMENLLEEIRFTGTPKEDTARFLQILARYITDESKKSLVSKAKSYERGKSCGRGRHTYMDMGTYYSCSKCGLKKTKPRTS
jgi:hypothetical protein